jgi:hypothetical protein
MPDPSKSPLGSSQVFAELKKVFDLPANSRRITLTLGVGLLPMIECEFVVTKADEEPITKRFGLHELPPG